LEIDTGRRKSRGKDRILLKQREELLETLNSLTNEIYTMVKEKGELPNPLNEKERMELEMLKRAEKKTDNCSKKIKEERLYPLRHSHL